ncbi:aminotransferase class IV [Phytoactinopolyspora limicola]|uniref:aminotransferase class IV n=1 Tax=Phytoactinopolyspora limicola TaxID=2715536 RepID=UPI001407DE0F|nr:aminotransferase class IV [Phytoactinopolyspora limicola]
MTADSMTNISLNGQPAGAAELSPLAFAGYAHFTAMQIRDGRTKALDLHLQRLRAASEQMFGDSVADDTILGYAGKAIEASGPDLSMTITVFTSSGEFVPRSESRLNVLVRTAPPATPPNGPLRLYPYAHERFLAEVKLVGETAKTVAIQTAVSAGFDDAVFIDRSGALTEASIWNLAFYDGRSVIWPQGRLLEGVTQKTIQRQLAELGVDQRTQRLEPAETTGLAAAVMNSWTPGVAVTAISDVALEPSAEFGALLHEAWNNEPAVKP